MRGAWVIVVVALAGCAGAVVEPAATPEVAPVWGYACEGRAEVAPGVCAANVGLQAADLGEAAIATSADGRRVVVAAMGTEPTSVALRQHAVSVYAFESTDGGATWGDAVVIPAPTGLDHIDASLVMAPDGTLHYLGLVERTGSASAVFHVSSADGVEWGEPTILSGETQKTVDRNWIALGANGTLYASWQEYPFTVRVAVSRDAGATWTQVEGLPECHNVAPVLEKGDVAFVTCHDGERTFVATVDVASLRVGAVEETGAACGYAWPVWWQRLVLVCESMEVREKTEAGWLASEPLAAGSLSGREDVLVTWAAGDATHGIHVLARPELQLTPFGAESLAPRPETEVFHLTLDAELALAHEALLTGDAASQRRTSGAGMWTKDDFHSIALHDGGAHLAWGRGGGIDVAYATTG